MRKLRYLISMVAALTISGVAFADNLAKASEENRNASGKIVRGPYVSNRFFDNWFGGVDGGINIFMNSFNDYTGKGSRAGMADVYVGKWFAPEIGVRLGMQGWEGHMAGTTSIGDERFNFWYLHGDVIWNITNTIYGYREKRIWNTMPYVHFGGMRLFNHTIEDYPGRVHPYDNEIAFGVGLYNTFRLNKRVYATFDVRETMVNSQFHVVGDSGGITSDLSASAGIGIYMGKVGWARSKTTTKIDHRCAAALQDAQDALDRALAENEKLKDQNAGLADKVDSLEILTKAHDRLYINEHTSVELKMGTPPCTLFFTLGSAVLNETELQHLDFYVMNIIMQDPSHTFYLTGKADAQTGKQEANERLSMDRVIYVRNLIMKKYGIPARRLIIKDARVVNTYGDPRLERAVIIEH